MTRALPRELDELLEDVPAKPGIDPRTLLIWCCLIPLCLLMWAGAIWLIWQAAAAIYGAMT